MKNKILNIFLSVMLVISMTPTQALASDFKNESANNANQEEAQADGNFETAGGETVDPESADPESTEPEIIDPQSEEAEGGQNSDGDDQDEEAFNSDDKNASGGGSVENNDNASENSNLTSEDNEANTDWLSFTAVDGNVELSMIGDNPSSLIYQWSKNKTDWTKYDPNNDGPISINSGETIYFCAFETTQDFPGGDLTFKMENVDGTNGKVEAAGNIMSLVSQDCSVTEMKDRGFSRLFEDCSIMNTSPKLPATTLARLCYESMFFSCTSLTTAPDLPATTLAIDCYAFMFEFCENLNKISVSFNDWEVHEGGHRPESYPTTTDWLFGVADHGTFICPDTLDTTIRDESHVPQKWRVDRDDYLSFTAVDGNVELSMIGDNPSSLMYQYSTDKKTWKKYAPNVDKININNGQTIYFCAFEATQEFPGGNLSFKMENVDDTNGKVEAAGNIMSLVDQNRELTTMAFFGFFGLFLGCTSLTTAPKLPATTLETDCYAGMFDGCESLEKAPELPATELVESCYASMFSGCTSLTTAPELPATTLATSCYQSMFDGCESLEKAPELPATELQLGCYYGMFSGCINLNYINVSFTSWNDDINATKNWMFNVAQEGKFFGPKTLHSCIKDGSHIPVGWYVAEHDYLSFTAIDGNIELSMTGNNPSSLMYQYSTDNENWKTYAPNIDKININNGQTIYFCAASETQEFPGGNLSFKMENVEGTNGKVKAAGNIMSLVDQTCELKTMDNWGFDSLFENCISLIAPPELPATTLATSCYQSMFDGCESLEKAPELPAITLANSCYQRMFGGCEALECAPQLPATKLALLCYASMFSGCISLTNVPELPAETLAVRCYLGMFSGCISLTNVPELSAETLAVGCYDSMFSGCTSLTVAPELPATTLADSCYILMFSGCEALECAPELPATTLAGSCYESMFSGCTSLTVAPELPATELVEGCYGNMFRNCTNLNKINVSFNDWYEDVWATDNWLSGVAEYGTFICPDTLGTTTRDKSHIPEGWEIAHSECLAFTAQNDNVILKMEGSSNTELNYQYSTNGNTWLEFKPGKTEIIIENEDTIYVRSALTTQAFPGSESLHFIMEGEGNVKASGNVMSLVDQSCKTTTMNSNGFKNLFKGCTNLVMPPKLPAIELADGCYKNMFEGCSSLTAAPDLPATTLAVSCYQNMFLNCTNLNYVNVSFNSWDDGNNVTTDWLKYVAKNGKFICPETLDTSKRDVSHIPENWDVGDCDYLSFTAVGDVELSIAGTSERGLKYQYLIDGDSWKVYDPAETGVITVSTGKVVSFRANEAKQDFPGNIDNQLRFVMGGTGTVKASGNIMSLVDQTCKLKNTDSYGFKNLFNGCKSLTTSPKLPAITLAKGCYQSMFEGCESLTDAPELVAKELAQSSYENMFFGCVSLEEAPDLPAGTLTTNCYKNMFNGCTKLNSINVSFSNWGNDDYPEFTEGWVSGVPSSGTFYCNDALDKDKKGVSYVPDGWIVSNPDYLSFTAEDGYVYLSMKNSDKSELTYQYSNDKVSWESFIPGKTSITIDQYQTIYFRAGLKTQEFPSTNTTLIFVIKGAGNVKASGNVMSLVDQCCELTTMDYYGFCSLFENCTKLITPPELPATTLAEGCYQSMFEGCENLTVAPELPATTLAKYCYRFMFYNCTKLHTINVSFNDWNDSEYPTSSWVKGVASSGEFICPEGLSEERGNSCIPNGWTIKHGRHVSVDFSIDGQSTGTGEYYEDETSTQTIERLYVPENTTFEVEDTDSQSMKKIIFNYPENNEQKIIYVKADEHSVIDSIDSPQIPITNNCKFKTKFVLETYNIKASVAQGQDEWGSVSIDGPTSVPYGSSVAYNNNVIEISSNGSVVTTITATATIGDPQYKYTFNNWTPKKQTITENTNFVASFTQTEIFYHVNYVKGKADAKGYPPVDENSYKPGDKVTVKGENTLECEGYTFAGWSDGESTYQESDTFNIYADTTLTAQWQAKTFVINYDSKIADVTANGQHVESGSLVDYGTHIAIELADAGIRKIAKLKANGERCNSTNITVAGNLELSADVLDAVKISGTVGTGMQKDEVGNFIFKEMFVQKAYANEMVVSDADVSFAANDGWVSSTKTNTEGYYELYVERGLGGTLTISKDTFRTYTKQFSDADLLADVVFTTDIENGGNSQPGNIITATADNIPFVLLIVMFCVPGLLVFRKLERRKQK